MKRFIFLFALAVCLLLTVSCAKTEPQGGTQEPPEPQHSHNHVLKETRLPTCTDTGEKYYMCECGDSYTAELPALGGECIHESEIVTPATCIAEGLERFTCTRCGDTWERVVGTDPWNHDHGEWVITVPATEDSVGERVKTCKTCGEQDVVEIPVTAYSDGLSFLLADEGGGYWLMGCDYLSTDTAILVPPTYKGLPVIRIVKFFEEENALSKTVTKIVIPDTVQEIDNCSFANMPALQSLTLPFVGRYGDQEWNESFAWIFPDYRTEAPKIPETLESVTVTHMTTLLQGSFVNCPYIKRVIFADNGMLRSVISRAFDNCPDLEQVVFPTSVQTFWRSCFSDCPSLKELTLPFIGHTSDGNNNFSEGLSAYWDGSVLPQIEKVTLTKTATIPMRAFCDLTYLKEVILPENVYAIESLAFAHCLALRSITLPSILAQIGEYAFYDSGLEHIDIPASVKSIGTGAFSLSQSLKTISFIEHAWAIQIGQQAFEQCGFTTLSLPANLKLGVGAFMNCAALQSVVINTPDMGNSTFSGCGSLATITFGRYIAQIPEKAFKGCTALKTLIFDADATFPTINADAFERDLALTTIILPNTLPASISVETFVFCASIQGTAYEGAIYLPSHSSPYHLLWKPTDKNITSCTVHADTRYIAGAAFRDCTALTTVTLTPANPIQLLAETFSGCTSLSKITLENVTSIGVSAFMNCTALKSIRLPDTLVRIATRSFENTGLTSITIPANVTSIARYAFTNTNLETAYFDTEWDWMWADGWYEYGVTDSLLDSDPYKAAFLLAKADYSILGHGITKDIY